MAGKNTIILFTWVLLHKQNMQWGDEKDCGMMEHDTWQIIQSLCHSYGTSALDFKVDKK